MRGWREMQCDYGMGEIIGMSICEERRRIKRMCLLGWREGGGLVVV